jgi:hypothetical protein
MSEEHFLATGEPTDLVPKIERKVSVTERHLIIKIWRALWKRMAGMKYFARNADPSKSSVSRRGSAGKF